MKTKTAAAILCIALVFLFSAAFAGRSSDPDAGKAHFNNPDFAGWKKSCSECHPDGSGLEEAGREGKVFVRNGALVTLERAINSCVEKCSMGKPQYVKSREMMELVSYIQSLSNN